METEPIDFDRDNVNTGTTVQIFNYLDNFWKTAVVQEIDLSEREILVTYDDDTQEWVGIDGRKICFPPVNVPKSNMAERPREVSSLKAKKQANKLKSDSTRDKNKSIIACGDQLKKSRGHTSMKSVKQLGGEKKKTMSKSSASASFLRLKFKPINKSTKPNIKSSEPIKKRRKEKSLVQDTVEDPIQACDAISEPNPRKTFSKAEQPHTKESKRELCKLRIRIDKNEARVIPSKDGWSPDKMETSSFSIANEKKIKTLLPKRSAVEMLGKVLSPGISSSPESSSFVASSVSLSPIHSTANVTSTINSSPTSSRYMCPKQDCKKQFRNENLLMMHIKHYHREYRNMLRSMPNVADLAYARTVGEHIESFRANFLEKIVKLEENRLNKLEENDKEAKSNDVSLDEKTSFISDSFSKVEENLRENSNIDGYEQQLWRFLGIVISHRNYKALRDALILQFSKKVIVSRNLSCNMLGSVAEASKSIHRTNSKRSLPAKRPSSSESSPKLPVLLAQLQGPPLVPSSISIEADTVDTELSVSQKKLSSVSSPQLSERSDSFMDSDEKADSIRRSPSKKRRLSQLDSTDVINCTCGYGLEDGLMIQCDLCQCWQHGSCVGFENESDVPSNYTCETCRFPKRCHSSRRYSYVQNWLKEGIVPRFQFSSRDEELQKKREKYLKQLHSSLCQLTELRHAVRSLQLKIQILRQTPDHPKLYLWAKSWHDDVAEKDKKEEKEPAGNETTPDIGPVPEDAINMVDCRKHLSDHIRREVEKADIVLQDIEEKIEKLEEPDRNEGEGGEEDDWSRDAEKYVIVVKQTFLMILRDLTSLQTFKYCE